MCELEARSIAAQRGGRCQLPSHLSTPYKGPYTQIAIKSSNSFLSVILSDIMGKYRSQLLDEMTESTLHDVAQNIMEEPIPEEVKRRLLKALLPRNRRPSPAPRPSIKAEERKMIAIVREFDPNFSSKALRMTADYQQEIPNLFDVASNKKTDELAFRQTPFAIGSFLRSWQMDVSKGHSLGAGPKAFLEGLRPQIYDKLEEEIRALNGIKLQLALKVQLRKTGPDGTEEYTDPGFRHKQAAIIQPS